MRQLLVPFFMIIFLSSCLKQSIADAMIAEQNSGTRGGSVATMTYTVRGYTVTTSVNNADSQDPRGYQLGCSKTVYPGTNSSVYILDCLSNSGEMAFTFSTDSLTIGDYEYSGIYGELFILSYNGEDEFVHDPTDFVRFNITSYSQGHISGTFSARLTPMIMAGNPNNVYGASGSVLVTNGSFTNVPVFY
jgi:hypothetical protein